MKKAYLGDGLYVEDHGFQFRLFTERENGVHEVYLEGPVLTAFMKFIQEAWGVEIVMEKSFKKGES